jgi:hypothetical protein
LAGTFKEMDAFKDYLFHTVSQRDLPDYSPLCFTARFAQSRHLLPDIASVLDELDDNQDPFRLLAPSTNWAISRKPHVYWLDLSQYHITPYFNLLFDYRVLTSRGKIEVTLR